MLSTTAKRKVTSYFLTGPGGRTQLWRQFDGTGYYVNLALMDAVLWGLRMRKHVVKEELLKDGTTRFTVREEDGSLIQWDHRRRSNQYIRRILLDQQQWQAHTARYPIRHQVEDMLSEGQLKRWPIVKRYWEAVSEREPAGVLKQV